MLQSAAYVSCHPVGPEDGSQGNGALQDDVRTSQGQRVAIRRLFMLLFYFMCRTALGPPYHFLTVKNYYTLHGVSAVSAPTSTDASSYIVSCVSTTCVPTFVRALAQSIASASYITPTQISSQAIDTICIVEVGRDDDDDALTWVVREWEHVVPKKYLAASTQLRKVANILKSDITKSDPRLKGFCVPMVRAGCVREKYGRAGGAAASMDTGGQDTPLMAIMDKPYEVSGASAAAAAAYEVGSESASVSGDPAWDPTLDLDP